MSGEQNSQALVDHPPELADAMTRFVDFVRPLLHRLIVET